MEQLKAIKGFERYTVSSYGRVFGVAGKELSQRKATKCGSAYGFQWSYTLLGGDDDGGIITIA